MNTNYPEMKYCYDYGTRAVATGASIDEMEHGWKGGLEKRSVSHGESF